MWEQRNIWSKVNVWVLQDLKTSYCLSVIWSANIWSKMKCFRSVKDRRNIWSKVKCLSIAGAVKRQPFGTLPVIRPVSLPPTLHYFSPEHFYLKCFKMFNQSQSRNSKKFHWSRFDRQMFDKIFALSHFHLHSSVHYFQKYFKCSTNFNLEIQRNYIGQDLIATLLKCFKANLFNQARNSKKNIGQDLIGQCLR